MNRDSSQLMLKMMQGKIKFCQVFIGQTGENILEQMSDHMFWEDAKGELIDKLGDETVEEEAWTSVTPRQQGLILHTCL